jgi:hypothetical protein
MLLGARRLADPHRLKAIRSDLPVYLAVGDRLKVLIETNRNQVLTELITWLDRTIIG